MEILLKVAGLIFLGYAFLHFAFPRRFRWREELARLSLLNRRIFVVHTTFIVLTLLLLGVLCVAFTRELLAPTPLGRVVLAGLLVFALARLLAQFFLYDASLWRGHPFNTRVHAVFVTTWSYLVIAFGLALLRS